MYNGGSVPKIKTAWRGGSRSLWPGIPTPCRSGEGSSQVADGAGWFPRESWVISKPPLRPVAKGKIPRSVKDLLEDSRSAVQSWAQME